MYLRVKNETLPYIIPEMAIELGLPVNHVISLFEMLGGNNNQLWKDYWQDWAHPNDKGYEIIANGIYKQVFLSKEAFQPVHQDDQSFPLIDDTDVLHV